MKDRTLIIAAHPDDDIIGCGGYIAKNSATQHIKVIFIAEGTSCRFKNERDTGVECEIKLRTNFAKEALRRLNVTDVEFYNLPCGRLDSISILDINKIIESEIKEFRPSKIFTHSKNDINKDHRIVYDSTMMACRPTAFDFIEEIYSFEILSSSEWNYSEPFCPNYFVELDECHVEMKWEALACYESEVASYPHPRSKIGVFNLSRQRGMQVNRQYVEAYEIIRKIEC